MHIVIYLHCQIKIKIIIIQHNFIDIIYWYGNNTIIPYQSYKYVLKYFKQNVMTNAELNLY